MEANENEEHDDEINNATPSPQSANENQKEMKLN